MTTTQACANPFVLMVNPQAVFAAIENSDRLARLVSRICRPLDRHAPEATDADTADTADTADAELDPTVAEAADAPGARTMG